MSANLVVIVGMGEVGKPLAQILGRTYRCCEVDLAKVSIDEPCSVLHICYPFQIADFVGVTAGYIEKYKPALTVINSTVGPGTTEEVYKASGRTQVAYSPVRGKHARMERDMLRYKKFVAGCNLEATEQALAHFVAAGFKTATFRTPAIAEISKLLETTYLGILVGWAQEVERIAGRHGAEFDEVNAFVEEIDFLPSHIFPGVIAGHCVIPNIAILHGRNPSPFLRAVIESNQRKEEQSKRPSTGDVLRRTEENGVEVLTSRMPHDSPLRPLGGHIGKGNET